MKRFERISLYGSDFVDYVPPLQEVGKYIVDDSNFIPMSETVKQLSKIQPLSKGVIEGVYDFPDGRDDGRKVEVARLRPEIVELSTEARNQQAKIKKQLKKEAQIAKDNVNLKALMNIKQSSIDSK